VDTEIDRRLEKRGADQINMLGGRAAVAQAKLAYRLFLETHSGERWKRYPDTLYVDQLIGPDTVNTLPEDTIRAFEAHGTLARTIDVDVDVAERVMKAIAGAGVDMDGVGQLLENDGIAAFQESFDHVLGTLAFKCQALPDR
jgi:transaldolase